MSLDKPAPWLISRNAYIIFRSELLKTLGAALQTLAVKQAGGEIGWFKDLRIQVHKIKGGAGFFGLKEIEQIANTIEERLLLACEANSATVEELAPLLHQLERLANALPQPPES